MKEKTLKIFVIFFSASEDGRHNTVSTLGALKPHHLTEEEKEQLGDGIAKKCFRVQTKIGVIFSKEYQKTEKNSFSVEYFCGESKRYGKIIYFIMKEGRIYAVIEKFTTTELSLLEAAKLKNSVLKMHKDLCPQFIQIKTRQRKQKEIIPVEHINKKCVFMCCQEHKQILSLPANMSEHN